MSEKTEISYEKVRYRKPVIVDDDYLTDIAKRLRMLRALVQEDKTRLT